jgi:hypothetical protein
MKIRALYPQQVKWWGSAEVSNAHAFPISEWIYFPIRHTQATIYVSAHS